MTSSLNTEVQAVTQTIQWLDSQSDTPIIQFTLSFSQTQWIRCKRSSLEWAALTSTQPCTVFSCRDWCESTALVMPESKGMNRQADWQAQKTSQLVCSLAWASFWIWTTQGITVLTAWRKEKWRKEVANVPPSEIGNHLWNTKQTWLIVSRATLGRQLRCSWVHKCLS